MHWLRSCGLFQIGALSGRWPAKARAAMLGFKTIAVAREMDKESLARKLGACW